MNFSKLIRLASLVVCLSQTSPALAARQEVAPPVAPPAAGPLQHEVPIEQWILLDRIAIVVNTDPVTLRGLERQMEKLAGDITLTTQAERQHLFNQAQLEQVETLLMRQAGEDLGFSKDAVNAHISGVMRDKTKEAGGIYNMSENLRNDSTTQVEISEDLETDLYERSFKHRVMGYGADRERTKEDRYVRPGTLVRQYRHVRRTGLDIGPLTPVGASPALYELQILLLDPQQYGSMEGALAAARQARASLEDGSADWDELIDKVGAYPNRGLIGQLRIEDIRHGLDPGNNSLIQFVMEGRQNVLSEVLPFPRLNPATGQRQIIAYGMYQLVGRTPAKLPAFDTPGVQKTLQRILEIEADDARLAAALDELKRSAYIWYPGIEQERAEFEEERAKRELEDLNSRKRNAEIMRGELKNDEPPPPGALQPNLEPGAAPPAGPIHGTDGLEPTPTPTPTPDSGDSGDSGDTGDTGDSGDSDPDADASC